jgi:hypothetical protein
MASQIVAGGSGIEMVAGEDVSITLSDTVACLAAVHDCKLKRAMNIRVGVGEV